MISALNITIENWFYIIFLSNEVLGYDILIL